LVAPLLLIVALTPIVVMLALLVIGFLMTPALVSLVAARRFAALERKKGGSFFLSLGWMLGLRALSAFTNPRTAILSAFRIQKTRRRLLTTTKRVCVI
jgi:hypothetical protein